MSYRWSFGLPFCLIQDADLLSVNSCKTKYLHAEVGLFVIMY